MPTLSFFPKTKRDAFLHIIFPNMDEKIVNRYKY